MHSTWLESRWLEELRKEPSGEPEKRSARLNLSLLIPLPPDYRAHKRQELRILLGVLIGELLTELFPPELWKAWKISESAEKGRVNVVMHAV